MKSPHHCRCHTNLVLNIMLLSYPSYLCVLCSKCYLPMVDQFWTGTSSLYSCAIWSLHKYPSNFVDPSVNCWIFLVLFYFMVQRLFMLKSQFSFCYNPLILFFFGYYLVSRQITWLFYLINIHYFRKALMFDYFEHWSSVVYMLKIILAEFKSWPK